MYEYSGNSYSCGDYLPIHRLDIPRASSIPELSVATKWARV